MTIPKPTGTGYSTTIIDFSSYVPANISICFHLMYLGEYVLPYHEFGKMTYVFCVSGTNRTIEIRSDSNAWNNFPYSILLIYKR